MGSDGSDVEDLEMIGPLRPCSSTAGMADASPNARAPQPMGNKLLAGMLTRQNVVISTISRQVEQLQIDQKQTVSTADEVAHQLKTIASEIQQIQSQTGRKLQLAGSHVEEQSAQIGQLTDAARSQYE